MFSNLRVVLRDIGGILILLGFLMLLLSIVSCVFKEFYTLKILLPVALSTTAFGFLLRVFFKSVKETELKHAMICAALAWLVVPALSSFPFIFIEGMPIIDSFFEAMSGWTATGLTMIAEPSQLSYTMQFWRSLMEWVGGVGVIVLMLSILAARPGTGAFSLYKAEGREEKIRPSVISTVRTIWWIYLLFTFIAIILFYFAGMPPWHAINHAMTALATGGFSVTENSLAYYNNLFVELAVIPMMILGAIPFVVHYRILREDKRAFFKDVQCKALLFFLILFLILSLVVNYFTHGSSISSFRYFSFQLISGFTTTGFQTTNVHMWAGGALGIVTIAMIIGGGAGSTAGGIKLIKSVIVYKGIKWSLSRAFLPKRAIKRFRLGNRLLEDKEMGMIAAEAYVIIILWIILLFIGVAVLSYVVPPEYRLIEIIFEVASAQSNVGLSTGIVNAGMSDIGKVMLIVNMWIGRLEIIPALMLFRSMIKGFEPV